MQKTKARYGVGIIYLLITYLFFFFLCSGEHTAIHINNALKLCFTKVIPSLFPFLVLNELVISSGLAETAGKLFGRPFSKLFRLPQEGAVAFISGAFLGFPLGTKTAVSLYENGYTDKEQTEKLICFCSNTGPSFILSFVGAALNSIPAALVIYFSEILSAIIIGLFLRPKTKLSFSTSPTPVKQKTLSLTKAIKDSVLPLLNVCAFVCFFSCISCSVEAIISFLRLNDYTALIFNGFLELTNGIALISELQPRISAAVICAFFIGWSGLSVILQSSSIFSKHGFNSAKFVFSKLIQGFLCVIFTFAACKILKLY